MRTLVWTPAFVRALERRMRRQPYLCGEVERVLDQLA